MSKIIVLAEQHEGELVKASLNAVGAAQSLAAMVGGGFDIALAGQNLDGAISALQGYGAGTIYQIESDALAGYTAQAYAQAFHQAVEASGANFVLAASTAKGKDCTPRVTARLGAGQASDVSAIEDQGGTILYTRPMWAGNIIGKVKINSDVQVATIRPTDFDLATQGGGESAVEQISPTVEGVRMRYISLDSVKSDRPALADADVVVSGGRGLKEADNFEKVLAPPRR